MAVSYKDYYAILGVDRGADADAIKKAYRKKARELHPDRNKAKGSEERFREVNEAYEVLGDAEKRARYDQLGAHWQDGAAFDPSQFGGAGGATFEFRDLSELFGAMRGGGAGARAGTGQRGRRAGNFSDFFEMLFGDAGAFDDLGEPVGGEPRAGTRARGGGRASSRAGSDVEAELELSLLDYLQPSQRRITIGVPGEGGSAERRTVTVNFPPGLRPGQRLRLPGHGGAGVGGGPAGNIYLKVKLRPEAGFTVDGDDLVTEVDVPAPIAVVGGTVVIRGPEGEVTVRIRPGTEPGTSLRVRERGLPRRNGERGDLRARVRIVIPAQPTERQRELYRQLAELEAE